MRMFNADGSEGEMCGNGIRCVAKYVYDHHIVEKTGLSVETGAGIKQLDLFTEQGKVVQVRVDMGEPVLAAAQIPVVSDKAEVIGVPVRGWRKNMGDDMRFHGKSTCGRVCAGYRRA